MKDKLPISVLFVEDQKTLRLIYQKALSSFIKTLYVYEDGLSAYDAYIKYRPDLVITDINIPGINGIDLVYKIKELKNEVKIILITADADSKHLLTAIDLGTNGFLVKPFNSDKLKARVLDISNQIILQKNLNSEMELRKLAEKDLRRANETLEASVKSKTKKLEELNKNLEKQVQEELQKRQKQQSLLIQKSRLESMGELSAGMAHEINQPLLSISMGLDNILHKVETGKFTTDFFKNKIEFLFDDIERIKKIIDHVRSFSKGEEKLSFYKVSLKEVVEGALSMVRKQYSNHAVKIEIIREGEEALFILGNKHRFEQVILNLLSNAKRAIESKEKKTGKKIPNKTIKIICESNDDDYHLVKIQDKGIGIPKSNLPKIFDPFFSTNDLNEGTGLGLSIVYGIIKDYNGKISVESTLNKGTTISVKFPKYKENE